MKKYLLTAAFLIILFTQIYSQDFIFQESIGQFKQAESFYINPTGFFYVTDSFTNEIYKLDTLGNVVNYEGGYGWKQSNFDDPVDVFANSLNVYVTDKNNHRIERFDKDLNYISQLYTRDNDNKSEQFGYPLAAATSNQGDLYILDSENNRVVKFDLFGNFIMNFGGYNDPKYKLNKPKSLAISPSNNIFVLDNSNLIIFDQYGNEINVISILKVFNNIRIIFNNITVTRENEILFADLQKTNTALKKVNLINFNLGEKFKSSLIFNDKLYILTDKSILVFSAGS
jgi:NHL repeat